MSRYIDEVRGPELASVSRSSASAPGRDGCPAPAAVASASATIRAVRPVPPGAALIAPVSARISVVAAPRAASRTSRSVSSRSRISEYRLGAFAA
jgi:hypothetical protein